MVDLLKKKIIDLSKKSRVCLDKKNLSDIKANVALVLDVSKSMYPLYKNGTIQDTINRILGLAINFDEHESIDAYVFGTQAHELSPVTINDINEYVDREIISKHKINQATNYVSAIKLLQGKYFGIKKPTYVIFITDGDDSNKKETKLWMVQICKEPIFWQFVGIGKENFKFLNNLDELEGRSVDNAGFMHVNDLNLISDEQLYDRLLNEFPKWLNIVKSKGIL